MGKLGIDPRVEAYLRPLDSAPPNYKAHSLYERLLHVHVQKIPQLVKSVEDVPSLDYEDDTPIPLSKFSSIYRWYGTPDVVEMIKPDLVGAAQLSVSELSDLFAYMKENYKLDYHHSIEIPAAIESFRNRQTPEKVGRITLLQDILGSTYEGEQRGGEPLRELACQLWSDEERQNAWGDPKHYVPDSSKHDFPTFKQDIANILYSAGLFEEKQGNNKSAHGLKALAFKANDAGDLKKLNQVIHSRADEVNQLVSDWQKRYPGHKRTQIAQFLQQTFTPEHTDS